ncbi:MAG: hypothetical protein M3209_00625 [Acidobacteriota bacterium]|nr:hypothetical protein [Acidobacteriota bacterium]
MGRIVIGFIIGLLLGGALTFFLFVGTPKTIKAPGAPIKAPDPGGPPPGTASVILNQQFFDTVLQTIFRDLNAPSFPVGLAENKPKAGENAMSFAFQEGCDNRITLKPEGSGVTTSVRLENGQIIAPLAFGGRASVPLVGCTDFSGWGQGNLELRFDEGQQTVYGQINVESVNLDGISPVVSPFITPLVQSTLNQRVNPIQILRGEQIALNLPIQAANGMLQARVKDVRSEIKENGLNLYITYNFTGTKGQ